ncbi:MAG: glucose-6-phosphate isomerase family protein [Anaerocolumna sp.]
MNDFNWNKSFTIDFDMKTGFSKSAKTTKRYLSDMKGMFHDSEAVEKILSKKNPVIYEFYELGCPEREGDLAFGTTIVYPGTVGDEYYMTKGHFHTKINTSEVYYTFSGSGYMLLENAEGDWKAEPLRKGEAIYVPRGYAHRTINTGNDPLIAFFTFYGDAGHDYGTIETKGYRNLLLGKNGTVDIIENSKWKN